MSQALGVALMVVIGAQLAPQAPLNRELSRATGEVAAALVSFGLGAVILALACLVAGDIGRLDGLGDVPADHLAGGLLGASFVLIALLCVGAIGAGGVAAAAVTGQLLASVALDAGGALGLESRPLTVAVAVGTVAVIVGTALIVPRANGDRAATTIRARLLPTLAVVAGGVMMGVQHPLNGELGGSVGDLQAGLVNFVIGTLALALVTVLVGQARGLAGVRRVRWYYACGGVLGAINATAALIMVDEIGAGAVAAAAVSGQMVASLALDRAGLLGLQPHPVTARRLLGAGVLVAGMALVAFS